MPREPIERDDTLASRYRLAREEAMRGRTRSWCGVAMCWLALAGGGCSEEEEGPDPEEHEPSGARQDAAHQLTIPLEGSLQNGAWSPDGDELLLTRFRAGYNEEPADLHVFSLATGAVRLLVSEGSGNVNLPGSSWSRAAGAIVFSSSREPHDEIYLIDSDGSPGSEERLTSRAGHVAYEPSFSPDGAWVVFESHPLDVEGEGVIMKHRVDGTVAYQALTDPGEDCRQPNWSPAGDRILYQRLLAGRWDLWVMGSDGTEPHMVTSGPGDKTDASFSPDGRWIVYSSDQELGSANLFVSPSDGGTPTRVTFHDGYDGAPSWSSSGTIVFESYPGDPDGSAGTTLWAIDAPAM